MTEDETPAWYYDDLGFCGCGDPDRIVELIRNYLRFLRDKWASRWFADGPDVGMFAGGIEGLKEKWAGFDDWEAAAKTAYGLGFDDLFLVIAYLADKLGFAEHGSSVYGAWLTDKGKAEIA